MSKTASLVKEGAGNDFDSRVNKIPEVVQTLDERRAKVTEQEGTIKDLLADVSEKKTRIEELNRNVVTLEGERTELTRRRDELSSNLATVTGERDSLSSQLNTAREDVARRTEQIAAMFTREQLDTEINAKNKMEDARNDVTNKYVQLYNWIQNNTGSKPPYPRDPNYVDNGGVKVDAAPETLTTRVIAISPSQGLISFSVGEEVGVRPDAGFEILVNDRSVGKVRISEVSPSFCVAQILPNTNLEALARGQVLTLVPFTGKVAAK
jgi:uncharacterized phage infection (PIP) family protein YhgE